MRRRELIANGMSEAEAQRAALDRFGDLRRARRECRAIGHQREQRMQVAQYVSELRQDVAFSVRQMLATRAFTTHSSYPDSHPSPQSKVTIDGRMS